MPPCHPFRAISATSDISVTSVNRAISATCALPPVHVPPVTVDECNVMKGDGCVRVFVWFGTYVDNVIVFSGLCKILINSNVKVTWFLIKDSGVRTPVN